jgi:hypothetical protein
MDIIWSGHVARVGDEKNIQNFGRKTWREETVRETYRRREYNIRMDLK